MTLLESVQLSLSCCPLTLLLLLPLPALPLQMMQHQTPQTTVLQIRPVLLPLLRQQQQPHCQVTALLLALSAYLLNLHAGDHVYGYC